MHEDYEDNDDQEYDDDDYNYDHFNKFNYKFDMDLFWSSWIKLSFDDMYIYNISNMPDFPVTKFPVNNWNPNTGKGNTYQYLGSNYLNEPIWKQKYFIHNKLQTDYINHIMHHAKHFITQPAYYKGMFDILN